MRNYIMTLLTVSLLAVGFSCADEDLDPLQFEKVKKGTLLALRGSQLDAIYFDGASYGDAFFANSIQAGESFDYDAEFLSEDPSSLASFDIFVLKSSGERILLKNVPFSEFKNTDDYRGPWVSVSLALSDILNAIDADLTTPANVTDFLEEYESGIELESDLNLTNGTKVLAADLVAAGLYESDQFYPAQKMVYGVEDIDDARPKATTSLRGQYSVVSGKVVRTVLPLKNGAMDTVNIKFDQSIDQVPSISIDPPSAGTAGALVAVSGKDNEFYVPFTAGASYTGNVTFNITGATSGESGALGGLEQKDATATIVVDNLAPQNTSFTTGTRLGKGQSATVTLKFNEAIGSVPTITIAPGATGIDGVTDVKMTLSADGLTATYSYEYKDLNNDAMHGDATVSISGGKDRAGNDVPAIASKLLTIDIGAAPAPSIVLDPTQFDWGTQIKWTINYAIGGTNPGGSTSGTVYYLAQAAGKPAPIKFVGGDVPAFEMAEDPASTKDPKEKVAIAQFGSVPLTTGTTGSTFSSFAPNGNYDVYVVIITSSGVISAISPATTVTMN